METRSELLAFNARATRLHMQPPYSMFPIKRTVFFSTVAVHKNTVRLIGNIEYLHKGSFLFYKASEALKNSQVQ